MLSLLAENIKALYAILQSVINLIHKHEQGKFASLIKVVIITFVVPSIFYLMFLRNYSYEHTGIANGINKELATIVNECGKGSYAFGMTISGSLLNILEEKKLRFNYGVGCLNDRRDCAASIVADNPIYDKTYTLSGDDALCLDKLSDGQLVKFNIINDRIIPNGDDICRDRQLKLLEKIISQTNRPLTNIRFIVVKDKLQNLIYLFSLSSEDDPKQRCSNQQANALLAELFNVVNNLYGKPKW